MMKSNERYSKEGGLKCPDEECNGEVSTKTPQEMRFGEIFIPCYCTRCNLEWTEEYLLSGYSLDDDPGSGG